MTYDDGEPQLDRVQYPCDTVNGQRWVDNSPALEVTYPPTSRVNGDVVRPTAIATDYPTYSG